MPVNKRQKRVKKKAQTNRPLQAPEETESPNVTEPKPTKNEAVGKKKGFFRKPKFGRRVNFILGTIIGICGAFIFAVNSNDGIFDPAALEALSARLGSSDLFEDIKGFLSYHMFDESTTMDSKTRSQLSTEIDVGLDMRDEGYSYHHPVVMTPGVISSGLESWSFRNCSVPYFRKRLWGSWSMLKAMLLDKQCWLEHLMLDPKTGLDPPGIRLRAAQGFEAADFFITGYWIWSKIIENLAAIGYEPNNMLSASYDWRLSYSNLEERDRYFSKLKLFIEYSKLVHGRKVVLISHSMGSQVSYYFLKWVEAEGYGNGGPGWVNEYIESFINISGSLIGAPKTLAALLSGEMKDTAQLNQFSVYGLEKFFSRAERAMMVRTMGGVSSMLPKGGNLIWGNTSWAADDDDTGDLSNGVMIHYRNDASDPHSRFDSEQALEFLNNVTSNDFRNMLRTNYSNGLAWTKDEVERNNKIPAKWINPLETSLPYAPDMKIYCFHGVGKPTERGYFYSKNDEGHPVIDSSVNDGTKIENGIVMDDGDGTLPLIALGFVCNKAWKTERFNPANISVVNYELRHDPAAFDLRGGPRSAEHVDILGHSELNEMVLKIVSGHGDEVKDHRESNILEIVNRINLDSPEK
ncbi:phospholipid-diacylglycerol acyltransferase Plh1 [Schizosaccharomyces octosporus yFS286]|uniref:Phospholipid:diacylglycerol acyltransferase n=1 Tax=Schizosaccharomyces octosporus (strain yFS286) TaxID=483514 RepID=S9PWM0_SCHOY|nr:phospholipid-diacylglycerol acyltransferase Plh1 [Schizosaccharomyces octosporus yFS286]EPX72392.1 phospholipid-diacylglycerol acyltransferase Plh1 [Schizosaccharomyces octosporus yFS286]